MYIALHSNYETHLHRFGGHHSIRFSAWRRNCLNDLGEGRGDAAHDDKQRIFEM